MPDVNPESTFSGDCFWCGEVFDSGSYPVCPTCAMPLPSTTIRDA